MKNITKLFNLLTAFLAVIGICAASLVFFIVAYTQINGGFSPQHTTNQKVIVAQTNNNVVGAFSYSTDSNDNSTSENLYDIDVINNYSNTKPIPLIENESSNEIYEQPNYEYDTTSPTIETDYTVNIETNNVSDSITYAIPIEQEPSTAPPTEQNDSNIIYPYEVPIKTSTQITNTPFVTDIENNSNTYNTVGSQASVPAVDTVWLSETGTKYHIIDHCGNMNPDKARQVSIEYAISAGYGKCDKCF